MPGPMCLIENVKGQLTANQEALGILSAITQPVVVVAIVGLYRTGKSYLMNKLAGKNTGDNQNDCWIFALAILLSSTFVYNSMGTINQQAMDQLHFVTELSDKIRARSSTDQDGVEEDSAEFVSFFPDFVWTLRDFSLELKVDGKSVSPDEYLENSLKLISGNSEKEKTKNLPRLCIRKFFPKKKCFVFERPAHGKKLNQLESLQDGDLDSDFLEQVTEFCSYIFTCSKTKTLSGGIKVNGFRLQSLAVTYINAISSGELPCMENAVLALSQIENAAAVQKAIAYYDQHMSQKVKLPTETLQELLDQHRTCENEAIKIFMKNSFKDTDQTKLEKKREEFYRKNLEASSDHCSALLQDLFRPLEGDVKQGVYSKPGGYHLFVQKTQELKKKYYEAPGKGIQAEEALQKFLQSKEDVTDTILQTDQTLTEKEKEIEVERVKAKAAQDTANKLEEIRKKNEQLMKEKEKSYQEHLNQLTKKMERERAQIREEQERAIEHKLKEQARLLQEGFREESKKLQDEINNLHRRKKGSTNGVIS